MVEENILEFLENAHLHNVESVVRFLKKNEWHWMIPEEIEDNPRNRDTLLGLAELHIAVHD